MTKTITTNIRFKDNEQYWRDEFQQLADNFGDCSLVEFIGIDIEARRNAFCKISLFNHRSSIPQDIVFNSKKEMLDYIVDFNKNNQNNE